MQTTIYKTNKQQGPTVQHEELYLISYNKCKKAKWLSQEAFRVAEKREVKERQRRKGKIYPSACRVLENSKEK